mmetsp:Transcript_46119/g.112736  ORF Transcript_46119/g.112736 Transcript_46119/m.112736 type:complete len:239 (+) Transcript_46119:598-1314(+)
MYGKSSIVNPHILQGDEYTFPNPSRVLLPVLLELLLLLPSSDFNFFFLDSANDTNKTARSGASGSTCAPPRWIKSVWYNNASPIRRLAVMSHGSPFSSLRPSLLLLFSSSTTFSFLPSSSSLMISSPAVVVVPAFFFDDFAVGFSYPSTHAQRCVPGQSPVGPMLDVVSWSGIVNVTSWTMSSGCVIADLVVSRCQFCATAPYVLVMTDKLIKDAPGPNTLSTRGRNVRCVAISFITC